MKFNVYILCRSRFHSLFDERMKQSADAAYVIEKATENPWQLIVQATALASGAIHEDDNIFEYTFFSGKEIKIPTSKLSYSYISYKYLIPLTNLTYTSKLT